jgi:hypothetical protein
MAARFDPHLYHLQANILNRITSKCNLFYLKYCPEDDLNMGRNMLPCTVKT